MEIKVVIDDRDGYLDVINMLGSVPPFDSLGLREKQVLSELNYWYNFYIDTPEQVRQVMTFDYKTRVAIMNKLDVSVEVLNNNLTSLRKKGFITGRELIIKLPKIVVGQAYPVVFNCRIKPYEEANLVNND